MFKFMNKVAHSYWYDFIGIAIVVLGCLSLGYFGETASITTAYKNGSWIARIGGAMMPIGLISVISALMSLESDRFETRLSNWGNIISVPSTVMTAYVDYMFGNRAAIITYPVTILISFVAIHVWHIKGKYNVNKLSHKNFALALVGASIASFAFSYLTDAFGFGGFANAHGAIFWTTTFAFAVSIIANLAEMFKLQVNNKAWIVYNVIQLVKALAQKNFANVYKYIYYMFNNVVSIVSWSDKGRAMSAKHDAKVIKKTVKA